ncbi:hypothetical protein A2230_06385 [candidate division WOR-1 bacterium RIFOXYA2_FULL_36_21]|uniref:Uncharacterized protein n=1 Tax=candidate division WOR-1 bacterium RIFOXYB2_FULL_36_35 TaxID=1802578 RepID=A0A1F4S103_UNCSA|nr:MAG: hypothetical protein A2230_06385 [candidate division WOR-1 bacterium RIFOXYA2_FULL_36_21]OGC13413.1 MAG: hypothetical protein A2290_08990 [candidate division WOR-1 bacterium RIFOXYB2_FULL_36_35]OGC14305.1 MAG: hypothetical protein A2282_00080 [candidate division WOR-1 bacterium RIFOXYA12_FULL_36_13]
MVKLLEEKQYERILLKEAKAMPVNRLKEVIDFMEFLSLKEYSGFDSLLKRTKESAEKKGFKLKDVSRLIKEARKAKCLK